MVIVHVKSIAINFAMFVNAFAMNAVRTVQIHCCWYEQIARIDPAQRISDPPCGYISEVNELSQRLFSSLTLYIRLSQLFRAPMQQWYTGARPQSTLLMEFKQSHLQ
jgi:hypothetical protein